MATILSITDFNNVEAYYCIPDLRFDSQKLPLNGIIVFAESKFLMKYSLTASQVSGDSDLKEALKYFTFAEWLRVQMLDKTTSGASVQKTQAKGTPYYDITREVESLNMATRLINEALGTEYSFLAPVVNY